MPYANSHFLFAIHGTMPGNEIWSCGLRASLNTAPPVLLNPSVLQGATAAVANRFSEFVTALAPSFIWSMDTKFVGVTGRVVDILGRTVMQAESISPVIAPSVRPTTLPNQCAIVVSLMTGTAGRAGKGRIYLPLLAVPVNANGRFGVPDTLLTAFGAFLDGVNTDWAAVPETTTSRLTVESKTNAVTSKITGFRVGDVIDTQRRRRSAIPEAYRSAVVA